MLPSCKHKQKKQHPKLKHFFIANYKISQFLEDLNSSLAQFAGELWLAKFALRGPIILSV